MLILILFLVVGAGLAYISQNNLMLVDVNVGPYVLPDVPLFYVIIGSLITGLAVSYIFHMIQVISSSLEIRGKKNEIKKNKETVHELTKRVHQLELENEKLKHRPSLEPEDDRAL